MGIVLGTNPQRSGLIALVYRLRAFLKTPSVQTKLAYLGVPTPTVTTMGFRQREQQLNASPEGANRIVLIPGWGESTRTHGALEQPRRGGSAGTGHGRTLLTWPRKFTASVWSYDPRDTNDEQLQIGASDTLLQLLVQGLYTADPDDPTSSVGDVLPGGDIYQDPFSANLGFGIEVLVPLVHLEALQDLPLDFVTDVKAAIEKDPAS